MSVRDLMDAAIAEADERRDRSRETVVVWYVDGGDPPFVLLPEREAVPRGGELMYKARWKG